MSLLIDLGAVPEEACENCLEDLFKALSETPDGTSDIWRPVENPYLTWLVENATARFQEILRNIQILFSRFLTGEPMETLAKAEAPWLRWDEAKFMEVQAYLESKPPHEFTLDDWLLVCELIIAKYLPDGVINTEAEYLTVKAALMGRIQANAAEDLAAGDDARAQEYRRHLDQLAELVPSRFGMIPPKVLNPVELATLRVAKARAAINISSVRDSTRAKMQGIIVDHIQAQMLGMRQGNDGHLKTALSDAFGHLNRDFRRIAVTEAGDACNNGFVAAQPPGQTVQRREAYRGACAFCKSINGRIFTVVDPMAPDKDGQTMVWVGKSNAGRSASPRKRVGNELIDREPGEMWWPAAGCQHPHCRGSWNRVTTELPKGVNPAFDKWLRGEIDKIAGRPTPQEEQP